MAFMQTPIACSEAIKGKLEVTGATLFTERFHRPCHQHSCLWTTNDHASQSPEMQPEHMRGGAERLKQL